MISVHRVHIERVNQHAFWRAIRRTGFHRRWGHTLVTQCNRNYIPAFVTSAGWVFESQTRETLRAGSAPHHPIRVILILNAMVIVTRCLR